MKQYLRLFADHMLGPVLAAMALVGVSTLGYLALTDLSVFDALYMTWITMGTVGFAEVGHLGTGGRIWTMFVILSGYGVLVSITARFTSLLLSGTFREQRLHRRRLHMQQLLHDHLIVVGFGRVGRATVEAARAANGRIAVIEFDPALASEIEACGAVPIFGDARDLDVLERAGIARATAIVATLSDPDNLVVVSTARLLRNDIRIVVRVADTEWSSRLVRAGANDLVPIYKSAGQHLALAASTDGLLGVMNEVGGFIVEELEIGPGSRLLGRTPQEVMAQHPHVSVVGIRRENDLTRWHEVDGAIRVGDVAIIVGPAGSAHLLD